MAVDFLTVDGCSFCCYLLLLQSLTATAVDCCGAVDGGDIANGGQLHLQSSAAAEVVVSFEEKIQRMIDIVCLAMESIATWYLVLYCWYMIYGTW